MKKLLAILFSLLLLAVVGLLLLPFLIPTETYRQELIQRVQEQTGRELKIGGEISVRLFPRIQLRVEDVTLGNPPGYRSPYFLHLQQAVLDVPVEALLERKLVIKSLHLGAPELYLETLDEAKRNWDFSRPEKSSQPSEATVAASPALPLQAAEISLEAGILHWLTPDSEPQEVRGVNMSARVQTLDSPLFISASMQLRDVPLQLQLEISRLQSLLEKRATTVALEFLSGEGKSLRYSGVFSPAPQFSLDGKVELTLDSLAAALQQLGGASGAAPAVPLHVQGTLHGTDREYQLAQAEITLADQLVTGDVACGQSRRKLTCRGVLAADTLDVQPFLSARADTPAASEPSMDGVASAAETSPPSKQKTDMELDVALQAAVKTLQLPGTAMQDVALQLTLKEKQLKLWADQLGWLEGTADMALTVDNADPLPAYQIQAMLKEVDMAALQRWLRDKVVIEGKGNASLQATATGKDAAAMLASLNGAASVSVGQGAIQGMDVVELVRSWRGLPAGEDVVLADGKTDFGALAADFVLASGVATTENLAMQSPLLDMNGKGTISLPDRTLRLQLQPTLFKPVTQADGTEGRSEVVTLPLLLKGPWDAVKIRPDLTAQKEKIKESVQKRLDTLLADPDSAKEQVQDIKEQLKEEKNKLKDLWKGLKK